MKGVFVVQWCKTSWLKFYVNFYYKCNLLFGKILQKIFYGLP